MAAPVLAYENLGLIQGAGWLFRGLDVHIGPRDRLALIGRNGAGKTTFFKALAGIIDTDEGRRTIKPGTRVVLRSEEHTSELQSLMRISYAVFCWKKKKNKRNERRTEA